MSDEKPKDKQLNPGASKPEAPKPETPKPEKKDEDYKKKMEDLIKEQLGKLDPTYKVEDVLKITRRSK